MQKTPSSYDGILLGDVVFQSLVIEFDLTKPAKPVIGIAPRNPLYVPTPPGQLGTQFACFTGTKVQILTQKALLDALKIPLIKRSSKGVYVEDPKSDKYRHGVDHVPVVMSDSRTAFLANISIGSPRQPFTVLLDTGLPSVCICVSACACVCACVCVCVCMCVSEPRFGGCICDEAARIGTDGGGQVRAHWPCSRGCLPHTATSECPAKTNDTAAHLPQVQDTHLPPN